LKFWDDFSKEADRREKIRAEKSFEDLFLFFRGCGVDGVCEVVNDFLVLADSGVYKDLMCAFRMETTKTSERVFTLDELIQVPFLRLSRENLHFGGFLTAIVNRSLVTAKSFNYIYEMITYVSVLFSGNVKSWDERVDVFFGGLDERLVFALEDFDNVDFEELPEPSPEYFKFLRNIKWSSKEDKLIYDRLIDFVYELQMKIYDYPDFNYSLGWMTDYRVMQGLFVQILAACNAVNEGRLEIVASDVIVAYKTFLKLVRTDVRKYKAIPERIRNIEGYTPSQGEGFLICRKCGSYYKLEYGESADDFEDTCDCGGHLVYKDSI
jgi:hypothetical protein